MISPATANILRTGQLGSLSDKRNTGLQGVGQTSDESIDVSEVVRKHNSERIQCDQDLRNEEEAEIRSLLGKEVWLLNFFAVI